MLMIDKLSITLKDFRLNAVTLEIAKGDYFVLLGPSGAGKTLLLESVAGLIPLENGTVYLNGRDITTERIEKRMIGLVYQEQNLFPHLSVEKNIAYSLHRKKDRAETAKQLAIAVGADHLLKRFPHTLSGGESQRVSLARALAYTPLCLMLDEPLASLDVQARSELRSLLRKIHARGQTVIHVTHDYEEAVSLGTQIAVIQDGTIIQTGTPEAVFRYPKNAFVASFTGIRNFFKGELIRDDTGAASQFRVNTHTLYVQTTKQSGPGFFMIKSADITLSLTKPDSSALNCFYGTVVNCIPLPAGIEVMVDTGLEITALVTKQSVERLNLIPGKKIWISFKATAGEFHDA